MHININSIFLYSSYMNNRTHIRRLQVRETLIRSSLVLVAMQEIYLKSFKYYLRWWHTILEKKRFRENLLYERIPIACTV